MDSRKTGHLQLQLHGREPRVAVLPQGSQDGQTTASGQGDGTQTGDLAPKPAKRGTPRQGWTLAAALCGRRAAWSWTATSHRAGILTAPEAATQVTPAAMTNT